MESLSPIKSMAYPEIVNDLILFASAGVDGAQLVNILLVELVCSTCTSSDVQMSLFIQSSAWSFGLSLLQITKSKEHLLEELSAGNSSSGFQTVLKLNYEDKENQHCFLLCWA